MQIIMYNPDRRDTVMKFPEFGSLVTGRNDCLCPLEVIAMGSHVSVEVARLRKSRVTDFTLVGLLSRVGPVVFRQS